MRDVHARIDHVCGDDLTEAAEYPRWCTGERCAAPDDEDKDAVFEGEAVSLEAGRIRGCQEAAASVVDSV